MCFLSVIIAYCLLLFTFSAAFIDTLITMDREESNDFKLRSYDSLPISLIHKKPVQVIERSEGKEALDSSKKPGNKNNLAVIASALLNWPNIDIWPFKFGIPLLGMACGFTGFFINHTFRKALYLEHLSKVSSYVATIGVPMFSSGLFHGMLVSADILEGKTRCPVCVQVKSAVIQLVFGFAYPCITAPVVSYSTAAVIKDIYLPKITKQPREVLAFTKQVFSTIKGPLGWMAGTHVILAMGITYFEQECYYSKILPVLEGKKTFLKPPPEKKLS